MSVDKKNNKGWVHKIGLLWDILKVYKGQAFLLFIIMLFAALAEALGLSMVMPLLEVITDSDNNTFSLKYLSPVLERFSDYSRLLIVGGVFVALILIKNILVIFRDFFSAHFIYRFQKLWQSTIMEKYLYAKYQFFLANKQGVLLNNLLVEPGRAAKSLNQLIEVFSKLILAVSFYWVLLLVNYKVTVLITVFSFIVMVLLRKGSGDYALDVGKKKISFSQKFSSLAAENISAVRQIKMFSLEPKVLRKFKQQLNEFIDIVIRFKIIRSLPNPVIESLVVIVLVSVLLYTHYFVKLSLTEILPVLGLFIVISQRFFPTVSYIFSQRMSILALIPSLKLVQQLYTTSIEQENLEKGVVFDCLKEDIEIKGVDFSYGESKLLFERLSFKIPKGKITAIVGPSGSGKTTVMDLLTGLFLPSNGRILINSLDLKEINLASWRKRVGYISQDTFLFNASVKENILVAKPDASQDQIVDAAKRAHADEFIRHLSKGYDAVLGDRGLRLSGGQRQRIAIARAIIRDPDLLIFDEATSSLDSESERFIQQSIEELSVTKTIIIISHRLSTVENADIIYVMDNGCIVEKGTFKELQDNKGRFHRLHGA